MEVSNEIKEEIRKTQSDLKNAIKTHQSWVAQLKDDHNNENIRARILEAENEIISIGQIQRKVIDRLRQELELYQQKLKSRNKPVNPDFDNKHIAQQLREYQSQKKVRKKSISLLKPSVRNELLASSDSNVNGYKSNNDKADKRNHNGESREIYKSDYSYKTEASRRAKDLDEDTEFIKATENFSLKDPAAKVQDRRANLTSALSKAACPLQNEDSKRSPSPKSESSTPSRLEDDSLVSTPSPSPPLLQPGEPVNKEGFMRLLDLITPRHKQLLEKKRCERKKRSTTSTNRNEFVYGNFESQMVSKKRRLNFPYLQQNIAPPTTRSQQQRKPQRPTACSPPDSPLGFSIPSGLTIIPVTSPEPMPCCICHHNDVPSLLRHCASCNIYYHWSCARRSPSPSQDSSSSAPSIPGCPRCGELPKDQRNTTHSLSMTVISTTGSSNKSWIYQEKLSEKRLLQERHQQLNADLKKLEVRAESLKENIEDNNIAKKQLLSEQLQTQKNLRKLLEFVNHFKDSPITLQTRKVEPLSEPEDSS